MPGRLGRAGACARRLGLRLGNPGARPDAWLSGCGPGDRQRYRDRGEENQPHSRSRSVSRSCSSREDLTGIGRDLRAVSSAPHRPLRAGQGPAAPRRDRSHTFRTGLYCPPNSGLRLPRKAATPSLRSSVVAAKAPAVISSARSRYPRLPQH